MKLKLAVLFCLIHFIIGAQQQDLSYNNAVLIDVLLDLEDKFNVRFSYKSELLQNKQITFQKKAALNSVLEVISKNENLEFIFLDKENIIIKSSFDPTLMDDILDEVIVVTEYLTSGFEKNKKDGSITLRPNKLGVLPGLTEPDILQSLQLLPGISSPEESAANLHIRGSTADHNLILYDGIKTYHQGHLFGMISPFNPYIVESVDIFRSGAKAKYGDRISGIIDIKSIEEIPQSITGGLGFNFLHSDAYIRLPVKKDKIGLQVSARNSINNVFKKPTFTAFRNKLFQNTIVEDNNEFDDNRTILEDTFEFTDFNTKLLIKPDLSNKISISGLFIENTLNFSAENVEEEGEKYSLNYRNIGFNAEWFKTIDNNTQLINSIKYSDFSSNYNANISEDTTILENNSSLNFVKDFGVISQLQHKVNTNMNFQIGYEFINYNIDYNLSFIEDDVIEEFQNDKLQTHSLYSEIDFKLKKWSGRFGLRTSYYNTINQFFLEPRVYLDYAINNSLKFKTSLEVKNQSISQLVSFEFNDLGLGNSIWVLSDNDDIPVLNNKQATLGFFYQKNGWKIDVESFYKKNNGISSFTKGFAINTIPQDYVSGNNTIYGLDILLKKKIKNFRTWLSYSYSKNNFEFLEIQPKSFPGNFDQTHVISLSNTYKYRQLNFALGWQFTTGKPFSIADEIIDNEIIFTQQNNSRLSNYNKVDVSAFYDFYYSSTKKIKSRVGFSIINLFNVDNVIDKRFSIDEHDNENQSISEENNLGLGFTPNFVFRLYF